MGHTLETRLASWIRDSSRTYYGVYGVYFSVAGGENFTSEGLNKYTYTLLKHFVGSSMHYKLDVVCVLALSRRFDLSQPEGKHQSRSPKFRLWGVLKHNNCMEPQ